MRGHRWVWLGQERGHGGGLGVGVGGEGEGGCVVRCFMVASLKSNDDGELATESTGKRCRGGKMNLADPDVQIEKLLPVEWKIVGKMVLQFVKQIQTSSSQLWV